mmetsp:Transcript_18608/g.41264  ORF Transcript_18608/g.41264 Transcript_18608/m.41264 type:complete len:188 (+) Transcript_18608:595-1158(+)
MNNHACAAFDMAIWATLACDEAVLQPRPLRTSEILHNANQWIKGFQQSEPRWWVTWETAIPVTCPALSKYGQSAAQVFESKSDHETAAEQRPQPTVACFIPAVWPVEQYVLQEIAVTFALQCDRCTIAISVDEEAAALGSRRRWRLVPGGGGTLFQAAVALCSRTLTTHIASEVVRSGICTPFFPQQ